MDMMMRLGLAALSPRGGLPAQGDGSAGDGPADDGSWAFAADAFEFAGAGAPPQDGAPVLLAALPEGAAAAAAAAGPYLTTYTSGLGGLGVVSDFNITIVFEGEWTTELQEEFILAAEYLSSIITGDIRNTRGGIDDITITATLLDIDGEGGILGQAGPTAIRRNSHIPSQGVMEFDTADAEISDDDALFDDIVLHEMMHCLGFGTTWKQAGLTTGSVRGDDMRFDGLNAEVAYMHIFDDLYAADPDRTDGVPVETDGGSGTAGGHWDDDTFENELMTGYIDDENYVSAMTVAALEDMGYDTVFEKWYPTIPILQPDDLLA